MYLWSATAHACKVSLCLGRAASWAVEQSPEEKNHTGGLQHRAKWLRASDPEEDLGPALITHMVAHTHVASKGTRHTYGVHTYIQAKQLYT